MNKEEIEKQLKILLDDLLESGNQDGSIISLEYHPENEEGGTCLVKMSVFIENNEAMFQGY